MPSHRDILPEMCLNQTGGGVNHKGFYPPLQVCSAHADEKVANMFLYNWGVADFFPVSDLNFDPFL